MHPPARADHWTRAWLIGIAAILVAIGASIVEPTVATAFVLVATVPAMAAVWMTNAAAKRLQMQHASVVRLLVVGVILVWAAGIIGAPVLDPAFAGAFTLAIAVGLVGVLSSGRLAMLATI